MIFLNAFIYDPDTGMVLRRQNCSEEDLPFLGPNVVSADQETSNQWTDATHWVENGALTERPETVPVPSDLTVSANGIDVIIITELPSTGTLYVDGADGVAWTDGQAFFSTTEVGRHILRLESFPYRDASLEVTGT